MWCYSNNRAWATEVYLSIEVQHSYTDGERSQAESWMLTSVA